MLAAALRPDPRREGDCHLLAIGAGDGDVVRCPRRLHRSARPTSSPRPAAALRSTCSISGTREVAGWLRLQDRKTHRDFPEAPIRSSPPSPPRAPGLAPSVRPRPPLLPQDPPPRLPAGGKTLSGASRPRAPVRRPLPQGSLAQPTAAAAARPSPLTGSSRSSHLSARSRRAPGPLVWRPQLESRGRVTSARRETTPIYHASMMGHAHRHAPRHPSAGSATRAPYSSLICGTGGREGRGPCYVSGASRSRPPPHFCTRPCLCARPRLRHPSAGGAELKDAGVGCPRVPREARGSAWTANLPIWEDFPLTAAFEAGTAKPAVTRMRVSCGRVHRCVLTETPRFSTTRSNFESSGQRPEPIP